MTGAPIQRFGRRVLVTPVIAVGIALALLAASLALALHNEAESKAEKVRQVRVQADILAASLAAPLAFDDTAAIRDYLKALRASPDIEAAGAYRADGQLAEGFNRRGPAPPKSNHIAPPSFSKGDLVVTAPVEQGAARLGSVYLRTVTETLAHRAMRYLGIALIVVMASLLVAVLGASYASLRDAHRKLQEEIEGRQKAEEALRQAQKMEAMGQLTGGVAHDFNNMLMIASSGLDLMDRTSDPVRRDRLKQGIRQAIDRGANLTQQLLTFARRSPLNPEVIDPAQRIREMHNLLDRSLREDISIDLQLPSDLWPVEVDPSQLEVALLNIALNGRDAMPNGGVITIRGENQPATGPDGQDMVRLGVTDSGIGMSQEVLSRVFEPFFTTKDVGAGTGLGLSQVYGFAHASGGEVQVESELGAGTTVTLVIPRSEKALPAQTEAPPTETHAERRYRVLLVEDDDGVAELVTQMFEELGYDASRTPTAAGALDALGAGQSFDLVFSDMVMPGEMNGLELAQEIARRWPGLPVVLTTGYSSAAAAAATEGIPLLVKPYRIDALAALLHTTLGANLTDPPAAAPAAPD